MSRPMTPLVFDAYIRGIEWPAIKTHHQKSDVTGKTVWDDHLTATLLTGSYIFPQHRPSYYRNGTRCGRNELLSAYILQQTGVYRTAKQCGSKVLHLTRIDVMEGLLAERPPVPKSYRDALIEALMPLLSKMRSLAAEFYTSKLKPPADPQLSTLVVSSGAATAMFGKGDRLPTTSRSRDIMFAASATMALLNISPSTPVLHAHLSLPPCLTLRQWTGIQLELHAPGASVLDCDTFTYVRGSQDSELRIEAAPFAEGAFHCPVAPRFLTDLLASCGHDGTREILLPSVMVIQRYLTRQPAGSQRVSKADVAVVVYTLDVARTASVTLARVPWLLPESEMDDGSSDEASDSESMPIMDWGPEVESPLTASTSHTSPESVALSTWSSFPSSSITQYSYYDPASFYADAPSIFYASPDSLLLSFPELYDSGSLPPAPILMSPDVPMETPRPRKTIRVSDIDLESMILTTKSRTRLPLRQVGGSAALVATKSTSLLSEWNRMTGPWTFLS